MEKILIVDDDKEIRKQLKWGLGKEYDVLLAGEVEKALDIFRKQHPKVITLDLGLLSGENATDEGFRCLEQIIKHGPSTNYKAWTLYKGHSNNRQ
jgi:two-component system NtrC family response regulator